MRLLRRTKGKRDVTGRRVRTGIRKINRSMIDVNNNMPYDTKFQLINLASSTILWLGLGICDWLTGH